VKANTKPSFGTFGILLSVFGIVNTDVGIGISIQKYPILVCFFGIPTQE